MERARRRRLGALVLSMVLAGVPQAFAASVANDEVVSDFYRWEGAAPDIPGRMLRREPLPADLRIDGAGEQHRILYSSIGGVGGEPTVVSGLVLLPPGEPPQGGWPVLAWAHGTVGVASACAPSWTGVGDGAARYLGAWLAQGFAVVATDYEGLGTPGLHPYLVKRSEAFGVLDSVRAMLAEEGRLSDSVVLAGQSQGAGAAVAAAGLAPDYAPELNVKGTVVTGVPYLTEERLTVSGVPRDRVDPGLAYVFYVAQVALEREPSLEPERLFTDRALPAFEAARTACVRDLMRRIVDAELTYDNTLRSDAVATLADILLEDALYPTLELDRPLFVGIGAEDVDITASMQLELVRDACAAGSVVQAHLYAGEDHLGAWRASLEDALAFARDVMRGERVTRQCAPEPRAVR